MTSTPQEKHLIAGLKAIGLDMTTTVGIMTMFDNPEQIEEMIDFLRATWKSETEYPSEQEVLHKLVEILKLKG